jgi:hypothetical protein
VVIQKRIVDLFKNGIPPYLKGLMPELKKSNIEKMETIRAELSGGNW